MTYPPYLDPDLEADFLAALNDDELLRRSDELVGRALVQAIAHTPFICSSRMACISNRRFVPKRSRGTYTRQEM